MASARTGIVSCRQPALAECAGRPRRGGVSAAGAKPLLAGYDEREKQATDTRVDPQPYVGEYESVALVFRVIPHEKGIALRVRGKVRFYDSDRLEESPPV